MKQKTIAEEIPDTKLALEIYRKGILKELDKYEPIVKRLKYTLKEVDKRLNVRYP